MKEIELIQIALMFTPLWQIAVCQFEVNRKRLNIIWTLPKREAGFPVLLLAKQAVRSMIQTKNSGDIRIFTSMKHT